MVRGLLSHFVVVVVSKPLVFIAKYCTSFWQITASWSCLLEVVLGF